MTVSADAAQPRPRRRALALLLGATPGLIVLALHATRYWPFIADDALISLRYSQRLVSGLGLTWTDGPPVEGYSNLLWVLGCAALSWLSLDLITAARVLGALGMGCAVVCVAVWERELDWRERLGGTSAGVAVALSGGVAVWSIGGLEQPLVAGLLALAVVCARPLVTREPDARAWPTALALALLCLTRPDGALLAGLVGLGLIAARGVTLDSVRLALRVGVPSLVAVLGQLAFRLAYYGDYVPNTARAKLSLTAERLASGWSYVVDAAAWSWPLLVLALFAARRPQRALWLPLVPLLGWVAYVVFIGGDIFPGRRHMVPAVVLLGILLGSALATALRTHAALGVALAALALGWQGQLSLRDPENQRAIDERWEWEGEAVGRLLGTAFAHEQPLLAVDPAGCLPYFSGLPALDLLGLNDRYLATHPPADFGHGWLGHELGDGDYVWSRQPDLVVLCSPQGHDAGCFLSGRELTARPDFRATYTLVTFEAREPLHVTSRVWVRRDGRVGLRHREGALVVPGFLLSGRGVSATLDAEGRVGASIPAGRSATYRLPERGNGTWELQLVGGVGASAALERGRLTVRAGAEAAHVRAVELSPLGDAR